MQPATHAGRIERQRGLHQHDRQRRADQRAQCEIAAREMHRRVDEAARELRHGGGKAAFENLFERVDSQRPVAEEEHGDIAPGEPGIERETTRSEEWRGGKEWVRMGRSWVTTWN